ncbi:PREDICTED: neuronal acetylcholine receptor subunit non-alpha-3-like, partial [Nicrophorus vespilloides]|uniref:Neuronal acetylcholine receptor subunit non-alpha-3-like n=1 Tax=Nicrophorus vespilloides TaxID=110193 RepID=A0ABM1MG11_NICVS
MRPNGKDCFALMNYALLYNPNLKSEMSRPANFEQTAVNVSINVESFRMLDAPSMYWFDTRLGANQYTYVNSLKSKIWKPKITSLSGQQKCCEDDEDAMFWRVYGEDGLVLLSQKMMITSFCRTNEDTIPFDTPKCNISFGSYRFLEEEVRLNLSDDFVRYDEKDFYLNQFSLLNITGSSLTVLRESGNFSTVEITFLLRRNRENYIMFIVIPCLSAMVMLYSTLWINNKIVQRGMSAFILLYFIFLLYNVTSLLNGNSVNVLSKFVLKN